jgi:invasion protein IalB
MRGCVSHLASGVAIATLLVVAALPLQAQQRSKPSAKTDPPTTQSAAQAQSPAPAQKQDAVAAEQTTSSIAAVGSSWRVECTNNGESLDCRAVQQVVIRKNQQLVAGLMVRVPADTKKPVMMVQMPLGILVSEAVELVIDEGKPERFNIQTCNQQGCFVGTPLAEALLAAMRNGKQLRIAFQDSNKQSVVVTMPLAGFALAYDKVKI